MLVTILSYLRWPMNFTLHLPYPTSSNLTSVGWTCLCYPLLNLNFDSFKIIFFFFKSYWWRVQFSHPYGISLQINVFGNAFFDSMLTCLLVKTLFVFSKASLPRAILFLIITIQWLLGCFLELSGCDFNSHMSLLKIK